MLGSSRVVAKKGCFLALTIAVIELWKINIRQTCRPRLGLYRGI